MVNFKDQLSQTRIHKLSYVVWVLGLPELLRQASLVRAVLEGPELPWEQNTHLVG